ncbi:hypothetical protein Scep_019243 [Stephania cephalantha]|uniref:Uncharacterized protein n=1 Tax=Stephania cephalantha TaxID=152367 RepID=A0AAP0IAC5_9MAGN
MHEMNVNVAFMMKIGWGVLANPEALWVRTLRSKYKFPLNGRVDFYELKGGSFLWRQVWKVWDVLGKGIRWPIGDGQTVRFWEDNWVDGVGPLKGFSVAAIPRKLSNRLVVEFMDVNGCWDWGNPKISSLVDIF